MAKTEHKVLTYPADNFITRPSDPLFTGSLNDVKAGEPAGEST